MLLRITRARGAVESGASRRDAADWFEVSPSSAIKWMQRRRATGSFAPKPSGGSISPLEAHAAFLSALIARQADLTLDEIVAAMHKRRIAGSRSAWRFFQRYKISFKKSLRAAEQARADVSRAQRRWMREQGMFDPARHGVSRRDRDLDQHGTASRPLSAWAAIN
jgi:transposase